MKEIRKVKMTLKSRPTMEGAGVRLNRAFAYADSSLDPFLLLDDFRSDNPNDYIKGFPWHPDRGIETITYMLHGKIEHGDSLGNGGVIQAGDVQWMTAGNGIIHQEMPKFEKDDTFLAGFQLWANLPASHKMMDPRYRDVKKDEIPVLKIEDNIKVKVICGEIKGVKGPVQDIITEPEYLDVEIGANKEFRHDVKRGNNLFAYVIEGEGYFDLEHIDIVREDNGEKFFDPSIKQPIGTNNLVIYRDGDEICVCTADKSVRFLLISGKPIREPVAWQGPIVMNTAEELRIAFQEFRDGTFIKQGKSPI